MPPSPAAIATSEWGGVPLRELLLHVGVKPGTKYVHLRCEVL